MELTYSDGEGERIALAISNSELRSQLLKLSDKHSRTLEELEQQKKAVAYYHVQLNASQAKVRTLIACLERLAPYSQDDEAASLLHSLSCY